MSVRVMSQVWDRTDLNSSERLVMLSLADHADDDGVCYPSISRLCGRTSLGERTVQDVIKRLRDRGFLTVEYNAGRRGVNVFTITPDPANAAPPQMPHPRISRATPRSSRTPTPATAAPEPSFNHQEPSEEPPLVPPTEKPPPKARLPADWALSDQGWAYARSQKIPDEVIEDEARGFHAYWTDRRDRDAVKSAIGWEQCWANRCRSIAPRYANRRGMAGASGPGGYGQGSSLASIVARRRMVSDD